MCAVGTHTLRTVLNNSAILTKCISHGTRHSTKLQYTQLNRHDVLKQPDSNLYAFKSNTLSLMPRYSYIASATEPKVEQSSI